jgi:hypothetical protein
MLLLVGDFALEYNHFLLVTFLQGAMVVRSSPMVEVVV